MTTKIISCDIHDHFEIACMRRSQIFITMHNGQEHSGVAQDLETKDKHELLHLKKNDEENILKIDLLDIKTLQIEGNTTVIAVSSRSC